MTQERRVIEAPSPFVLRNMPLRPRAWQTLVDIPDALHVSNDDGEIILVPERGQLRLYWAFLDQEAMRASFPEMFEAVRTDITADRAEYVAMDISGLPDREWLNPLLTDADFKFFAEWMEMVHPGLDPAVVPEFPAGVRMRRAQDADIERMRAIWLDAYGALGDGERTIDALVEEAEWAGVLEAGGAIVGLALNGAVVRGEGQILTAAVAPEHWGHRYGKLIVAAAAYQLASREALHASIRVRPDITQSLRMCAELGFRHARAGLEYRRDVDEAAIAAARTARRVAGVKARFGNWR
ncbi:MAG: GNAT family N-acetyltransferase [Dehalococcoidia bacterium]|nr:GNAT family N-acetyltransferase [Dehalococcoidia bacterium]